MQDPAISKQGKLKMLTDVQSGKISEQDSNGIIAHIYASKAPVDNNFQLPTSSGFQMHETIPGSQMLENSKFTVNPDDSIFTGVAKTIGNVPANIGQMAIGA